MGFVVGTLQELVNGRKEELELSEICSDESQEGDEDVVDEL